ncbi:MAG: glycoside hydrolase [Christensenellales bacterium]|jgi:hypothetical protein
MSTEDRAVGRRKNISKAFRGIFQAVILLLIIYAVVTALVTTVKYVPYEALAQDSTEDHADTGFVSISYFGVDRSGTDDLIGIKQLDSHLKALYDSGYVTVTQQDIIDYYAGEKQLPEKSLLLLFEDGRRDTAIFAQSIMEEYNFKATMSSYSDKFEKQDPKFLTPSDMNNLLKSSFWELGTNGHRLYFINVFDRYDRYLGELSSLQFSMVAPYINRKYDHYLMDFIRDEDGAPKESYDEMKKRLDADYDLMEEIYTKELGYLPQVHTLMHSNTGQFGTNDRASAVNAENIFSHFNININREGYSFNNRESSIYDLTRMQPQPQWSANHLLMRLWDDTGQNMAFKTGDEQRASRWTTLRGQAFFEKSSITLTSLPGGEGQLLLNSINLSGDFNLSLTLDGNAFGSQAVLLGADDQLQSYVKVAIKDKMLEIGRVSGGGYESLFSQRLDIIAGQELVSVPEDIIVTKLGQLKMFMRYAQTPQEAADAAREIAELEAQTDPPSVEDGAEEFLPHLEYNERQNKKLSISFSGGNLTVLVDGITAVENLPVAIKGGFALESATSVDGYSQRNLYDDVYDGIFFDIALFDGSGNALFDNRLKGLEAFVGVVIEKWNLLIDWFVDTL